MLVDMEINRDIDNKITDFAVIIKAIVQSEEILYQVALGIQFVMLLFTSYSSIGELNFSVYFCLTLTKLQSYGKHTFYTDCR